MGGGDQDYRADEAKHDIGEEAEALPAHQLPSEPSGDESDDDCSEEVMHVHDLVRPPRGVSEAGGVREWFPVIPDGRRGSLLFLIHWSAAALQLAAAALGDDYLGAALATDVNFSELVSHFPETLLESMLCPKLTRP
ncbi:MAG TPA: hypothetical protein VEF07_08000 [Candidatus Binataceae bacterium]|nr:hypothetical protein [Candidatus Binataceae bacterium]